MLCKARGTPRLPSVKPPFLFNHPLSALWVGARQVSGNAEGYVQKPTFHGISVFSFPISSFRWKHQGGVPLYV
jgi:hypothetical protein